MESICVWQEGCRKSIFFSWTRENVVLALAYNRLDARIARAQLVVDSERQRLVRRAVSHVEAR
jgi:hypothetical protein